MMWRKIRSSVIDPDISETRILRATYLLFLKGNEQWWSTASRENDGKGGLTSGHGPAKPLRRSPRRVPDNLALAIVEDIAEKDGMVTTWVVILHPLTGQVDNFESPLVIVWGPCWRCGRRGGAHGCNEYAL